MVDSWWEQLRGSSVQWLSVKVFVGNSECNDLVTIRGTSQVKAGMVGGTNGSQHGCQHTLKVLITAHDVASRTDTKIGWLDVTVEQTDLVHFF